MNINLSLYQRLISAIFLLTLIIISFSVILLRQINSKDQLTHTISEDIQPSVTYLSELTDKYQESKSLISYWGNSGAGNDNSFKESLKGIFQTEIDFILGEITTLAVKWSPEDLEIFKSTNSMFRDSLYFAFVDLIKEYRFAEATGAGYSDIDEYMQQHNILFLLSEVEQNLSYLLDKRKIEMNTNFLLIEQSTLGIRKTVTGFTILMVFIILFFAVWSLQFIRRAMSKLNTNLKLLTQGVIPAPIEFVRKDEMGVVFDQMNKLFAYLKNLTEVSRKINQKEFNYSFNPLSEKDELGIALLNLQNNLKKASEEEFRRKKEDSERGWTAEGIARINEILRMSSDKLEDLAFALIKEIATYTTSRVGALYILNDNETEGIYAEMIAAYAYDRQKFIQKKIANGEGLVGRCMQENETVYLSEVPQNYLTIKTGLGESPPVSILIVPLHLNENVYGVIELAAFEYFEPFKIRFIETIGESIATSISKVKINLRTSQLLEQTRQRTEEMFTQEEEMRQNMEQLRSTQEKSAKKEEELKQEIENLKAKLKLS